MSQKDFHRRSYGYTSDEPKNKKRDNHSSDPKKRLRTQKQAPFQRLKWLILPIVFVFKLLGLSLRGLLSLGKGRGRSLFKFTIFAAVIGLIGTVVAFFWVGRNLPDPNQLTDRQVAQSTKIYDRSGEHVLYEIYADKNRTLVTLDDIPQDLINGAIATEDTRFYEHRGIRPLSILRAIVMGILKGERIGGTSTLTQQLVKNAILTPERAITRKMKEAILSIRLEQKYSKDQILQIYFNEIPYGSTNYGVEAAAQDYFGKSVSELNLEQMATLAGLPKKPSTYLRNETALKQRRDFVLYRMQQEGYIDTQTMEETQAMPVSLKRSFNDIDAPHFSLYVRDQLVDRYGEKMVDTGGLKVITTLDWDKQQIAQDVVSSTGREVLTAANANNTALVAMDPRTGHIVSLIGSADFFDDSIQGKFNVATLGKRQPGSSFKPIIYTAAFEKGYTPETLLFDVETNFAASGNSYKPRNYDLSEHGPVTMRKALQGSLNIPAVKTLYLVGEKKGVEFAERLGYSTLSDGNFGLSLVLGGGEVTLLEHVNAYATFANQGIQHDPVTILSVEDSNGDMLYEWSRDRGDRVLEPDVANTITGVLSDNAARAYAFGENSILTLGDRPVAAKTGTTNSYVDGWTVGYTPSLVAGVWAGNTDNTAMKRGFGGSKVAGPIWNEYMRRSLADTATEDFPDAPENDAEKPILRGSGQGITLKVDEVTSKLATSSTPENYIVERTYMPPHSILHYVNKDEPRGPAPEDPSDDPQYEIWEQAIQDWITRKKEEDPDWDVSFEEPPTEYDDMHSLDLIPSVEVVYPQASSTIDTRQIDTDIRVSAPRGVTKVTYRLDTKYVGVVRDHPFNLNYYAQGLAPGPHTLTILVEDDVGNRVEKTVPFILSDDIQEDQASVSWSRSTDTLPREDFPHSFFLDSFRLGDIDEIVIRAKQNNNEQTLTTITDPQLINNQVVVTISDALAVGEWTLTATAYVDEKQVSESEKTVVIQ